MTDDRLLLGLSDVAALARVDRPLVSMWRRRKAHGSLPFPRATVHDGARELFDAGEVTSWLAATGLGKNAAAADDVALFALLRGTSVAERSASLTAVSALLALSAASRASLAGLDGSDLLDLADDVDPHDLALFREVEALGDRREEWAARTDAVVSAAYTPDAAFAALLGSHDVLAQLGLTSQRVSPVLSGLVARLAAHEIDPGVVLGDGACAPAFLDLAGRWDGVERPALGLPEVSSEPGRFMRRAAMAAGWSLVRLGTATGPSTGVAHALDLELDEALTLVSELSVTMADGDRWVVVGTAAALADRLSGEAAEVRADVLRTGRVRAVVALPAGLRPAHPRERLALWVLGDAHAQLSVRDRWTSVADLTGERWDTAVAEDLFSDVAAALAGPVAVRSHASRFARVVPTADLLVADSMLARSAGRQRRPTVSSVDAALEVTALAEHVGRAVPSVEVELWQARGRGARVVTLGDLVARGEVALIPGCRLSPDEVRADGGVPVFGRAEAAGGRRGARTVDRLRLAAEHPSFTYTEPGDVVVVTDVPGGVVDDDGFGVIEYPARGLRVSKVTTGLSPHILLSAVRDARAGSPWRSWPVALAPPGQVEDLERALAGVERTRTELVGRLAAADSLRSTLMAGVADGLLTLTPPTPSAVLPS